MCYYKWDIDAITEKVNSFSEVYRVARENVNIFDVLSKTKDIKTINHTSDDEDENDNPESKNDKIKDLWIAQGFWKPYRCLINSLDSDN